MNRDLESLYFCADQDFKTIRDLKEYAQDVTEALMSAMEQIDNLIDDNNFLQDELTSHHYSGLGL